MEHVLSLGRRMRADRSKSATALVHDRGRARAIPAHRDSAHEEAVAGLADHIGRDELSRRALGLSGSILRELRVADRLERLKADVSEGAALRLDPWSIL